MGGDTQLRKRAVSKSLENDDFDAKKPAKVELKQEVCNFPVSMSL